MRQIPDLMLCLQELTDGTVRQIRKTAEDPPRVSVFDVIQVVTKVQNPRKTWETLKSNYPEVVPLGYNLARGSVRLLCVRFARARVIAFWPTPASPSSW